MTHVYAHPNDDCSDSCAAKNVFHDCSHKAWASPDGKNASVEEAIEGILARHGWTPPSVAVDVSARSTNATAFLQGLQ